jgi:hypothetical protein
MAINYNGRRFALVQTSTGASGGTIFEYHQRGEAVWGSYSGGTVEVGSFVAKSNEEGVLDLLFQHLNTVGVMYAGRAIVTPEPMADGRLRLNEFFEFTIGGVGTGISAVEEIRE